jgi:hypothetical protein
MEARQVKDVFFAFCLGRYLAERSEEVGQRVMTCLVPSAAVSDRARSEGWSEARVRAIMPYHRYEVREWLEEGGEVLIVAVYAGVDS